MTGPLAGRPARLVIDASAVVALLADAGPAGEWVATVLTGATLSAPELMAYEASNVLRRRVMAGSLDASEATLAHRDLMSLAAERYPYAAVADRAWQLRHNLTTYDAAYVALAELLAVPLVTLDVRIARAAGPRCQVLAYQPP